MSLEYVSVICALVLILVDCIYGTAGALISHTFSSTKMRNGLMHKSAEIVVIGVAYLIQWATSYGLDLSIAGIEGEIPTGIIACVYIVVMELGSICELCVKYNPDLATNRFLQIFAKKESKDGQ